MNLVSLRHQTRRYSRSVRCQQLAAQILEDEVVGIPAEAVWGLSCDPFSEQAVHTLLHLKRRPVEKGLIVAAGDPEQFAPLLARLTDGQRSEVLASWPGPNTWLVPNGGFFPDWITGGSEEVAIRVTAAPALAAASLLAGTPLVSTSANPGGALPARFGFQVARYFGSRVSRSPGQVDLRGKPSTIRRVGTGEVLRA